MKVMQISDIHLDERREFDRTAKAMMDAVELGESLNVDAFVFTGDLAGRDSAHLYTPAERLAWARTVMRAANRADVVLLAGNHDLTREVYIYSGLRGKYKIRTFDAAGGTISGFVSSNMEADIQFICVPYYTCLAVEGLDGLSIAERNRRASAGLVDAIIEMAIRPGPPVARMVLAHLPVADIDLGGFEISTSQDVCLTMEGIREIEKHVDAIALGHIHRHQQVSENTFYAGSLCPQDHSEVYDHGVLVWNLEVGGQTSVEFHKIESWTVKTSTVEDAGEAIEEACQGDHLRVRVDDSTGVADIERMKRDAQDRGITLQIDRRRRAVTKQRNVEVLNHKSDDERLHAAILEKGYPEGTADRALQIFAGIRA